MKRLHITAEGQTEELFVRKMLTDHLGQYNICTDVRCVMTSRDKWRQDRIFRGGMTNYAKAKNDIVQWLREEKQNSDVFFSTMFDLYALPFDFPGYDKAHRYTDPYRKVAAIESAFMEDIGDYRFIPYIQLHEFESLLLSLPSAFAVEYFEDQNGLNKLIELTKAFPNPELIDGGVETAPSKRIIKIFPSYEYNKPLSGSLIAQEIGMQHLLSSCRHFAEWVKKLEKFGTK